MAKRNSKPEHRLISLNEIELLQDNPRFIYESEFKKLIADIKADPTFLFQRPPLLNQIGERLICYAGHQRIRAAIDLGYTEIHCFVEKDVPEHIQRERTIKDNTHRGRWDTDMLSSHWDTTQLVDWGVSIPGVTDFNIPTEGGIVGSVSNVDEKKDLPPLPDLDETGTYEDAKCIKITFKSLEDAQAAESSIKELIESFEGAVYSLVK